MKITVQSFCKGTKTRAKHKINLFIFALLSVETLYKGKKKNKSFYKNKMFFRNTSACRGITSASKSNAFTKERKNF